MAISRNRTLSPNAESGRRVVYGDMRRDDERPADDVETATPAASRAKAKGGENGSAFFPVLFLFLICVPIIFVFGTIRMSPYRVMLALLFVPMMCKLLFSSDIKLRFYDISMVAAYTWAFLGFMVTTGFAKGVEPGGVLMIEGVGAYLLGRIYVRNAAQYTTVMKYLVLFIMLMFPFTIQETLNGVPLINQLLSNFALTLRQVAEEARLGLERVQGVFEHSIHFGIFCATPAAALYYMLRPNRSPMRWISEMGVIVVSVFLSLSSGAMLAVALQFAIIGWDKVLAAVQSRWKLLIGGFLTFYVLVDVLSNRSPIQVLVSTITFNVGSSYNRIFIWEYGTLNVANNPIFGLGLRDWERPFWMVDSFDNFWLLLTMRHGIPFFIFFMLAIVLIIRKITTRDIRDATVQACRSAYMTSFIAVAVGGTIVHFWNGLFVWFMFMIGCGAWLAEFGEAVKSAEKKRR